VNTLRKFAIELRTAWHLTIEYRIAVFIWIFAMVLPFIMLSAWLAIAESGPVGRFGRNEFIAYYIAVLIVRNMTGVFIIWEQDYDIRQGQLSFKLLKPMNPVVHYLALSLGSKPVRMVLLTPLVIGISLYFPAVKFAFDPVSLLLFGLAMIGNWLILFFIQYITGLLAFWITQSLNVNEMWFMVFSLFSGYLIPLELFPAGLRDVLYASPFRYMLSFSAEVFTGQLTRIEILQGLAIEWFWVGVFYVTYRFVWWRGLRRFSAVGA